MCVLNFIHSLYVLEKNHPSTQIFTHGNWRINLSLRSNADLILARVFNLHSLDLIHYIISSISAGLFYANRHQILRVWHPDSIFSVWGVWESVQRHTRSLSNIHMTIFFILNLKFTHFYIQWPRFTRSIKHLTFLDSMVLNLSAESI